MNHQTDWRQQSAMETSQSERGWDFRPEEPEQSFNPLWIVVLAIVLIGGSLLASVSV